MSAIFDKYYKYAVLSFAVDNVTDDVKKLHNDFHEAVSDCLKSFNNFEAHFKKMMSAYKDVSDKMMSATGGVNGSSIMSDTEK